jgi:hypothetical protein
MKKILNIFISITCVLISVYFGIKIYKELTPKPIPSYKDQQIHCLEMGSDSARNKCLNIINGNQPINMNQPANGNFKKYADIISKYQ